MGRLALLMGLLLAGCRSFDGAAGPAFSVSATEFPAYVRIDFLCEGSFRLFQSDSGGVWHQQGAAHSPFLAPRSATSTQVNLDCLHDDGTRDGGSIQIAAR